MNFNRPQSFSVPDNISDMYQRPSRPSQEHGYYKEREQSRQINYDQSGNDFSGFINADYTNENLEAENKFRYSQLSGKKGWQRPYSSQLPYRTTPKTYIQPEYQMIPESTRMSRVCFNEALDKSGPFYLRQWPIWDNAPFLPSVGDVTKDPRYGMQTKSFLTEYRKI